MECNFKYKNNEVWDIFIDSFQCMPLAAIINGKNFLVHGGITPNIWSAKEI